MLCKTFKINSKDFTAYAHKYGLSVLYTPIAGLPEKYTMDGTLHDDILTNKATYTVKLNPVLPAIAKEILTEYRSAITVTTFDIAAGTERTVYCKVRPVSGVVAFVKKGNAEYWKLEDLVFIEK